MPTKKRPPVPTKSTEIAARRARRNRRRERSREEILDSARRVLLRGGVAATTLEAVGKEVGMSKGALYYYFKSKNTLLFELIFDALEAHARAVHAAVERTESGGAALRAVVSASVNAFVPRFDDFRLAFLHGQVAVAGAVKFDEQQFARIRPLNDLLFGGATQMLINDSRVAPSRANVKPRLMAFLAYLAALGMLTMKGTVESVDDPLAYSDEEIIEGFARVFEAAAAP